MIQLLQTTLFYLVLLATLYYAWFFLRAFFGLRSLPVNPPSQPQRGVSVLIPARNEERNIGHCLAGLLKQDMPHDSIEFIVIDDGSTDATARIVSEYHTTDPRITLLKLGNDTSLVPSRKRGRKPEAIAAGIAAAKFPVIVTTDADCVAPITWVRTLTGFLNDDTVYVVGPVLEDQGSTFFTRFRSLEVLVLIGFTGGRIGIKRPINGHGGNTAFLREVYEQSGGFDFNAVKSDEETLMHEVVARRLGSVGFAPTPLATVYTFSPPTFSSYWNQRLRWTSMHGRFSKQSILFELIFLYLSLLFPLAALAACFWIQELLPLVAVSFAVKFIVDYMMLRLSAQRFGCRIPMLVFFVSEIFHTPILVAVSIIGQVMPYRWKDRKVLAVDAK
jgi:cellulose synthase/poly-beta-1,6-N-acetylglucosamine synthase-like glycosyltransferase